MEYIREASEAEMILVFLQGEYKSNRFSENLQKIMAEMSVRDTLILQADLNSAEENALRREILARHRGYPDQDMFENFPEITRWYYVRFSAEDIDHVNYIDYSYWNELSQHTSKPTKAAETIRNGIEIYEVENTPTWEGLEYLKDHTFPPVILITANEQEYLILEGHSRMTVYGMDPELLTGTYGYIGSCTPESMRAYDDREFLL